MYRTELDVVNACIATMGEAPINALNDEHPFKQPALDYLKGTRQTVLKESLWFNTEVIRLVPEVGSRFIYVPHDALKVQRAPQHNHKFVQRGRRLYDPFRNRYEWDTPVVVQLTLDMAFEDLPFSAQDAISLGAVLRFQREFDGDGVRYQQLNADMQRATVELNAEHIREQRVNMLTPIRNVMAAKGITRYHVPNHVMPHFVEVQ